MWRIGWAPNSIPIYIQQDANLTHFIYIGKLPYMFRVVLPPNIRSAYNSIYSIWYLSHRYCYLPLSWKSWNRFECAVGGLRHPQHDGITTAWPRTQHDYHHDTKVKPEAATAVIELLMMGGRTPETCWVVNKRQDNKLENCCNWLVIYLNFVRY
jgi:hypothetical protein